MTNYNFNVKIFGNVNLVVPANSYKEAKEKLNNLINDLTVSDMENIESHRDDIKIISSKIKKDIHRTHSKESER